MIARVEPLTSTRRLKGPFDYSVGDLALAVGSIVRVPFGRQTLDGVVVELADQSEFPLERLLAPKAVREESVSPELVGLAEWIAREYCSTFARALGLVLPPPGKPRTELWAQRTAVDLEGQRLTAGQKDVLGRLPGPTGPDLSALRRLEKRGLVEIVARQRVRTPMSNATADNVFQLTDEQSAALSVISSELGDRTFKKHLLFGVTGSGKTEVYLQAAEAALEQGRGVIVLVPEIALTPQTVARFQARFGDTVALLHSALSEGERYDEWCRLSSGEARIAVGPRSAIFAPVENLGLIVIDEEHDSSYKHEGDPRYDARLVAEERARRAGATLVLGSATPRPETWHSTPQLRLTVRVADQPLPPVEILDMRQTPHPLHPRTREALMHARKAIVLLNRRGWSNFITCRTCGKVWECPHCEVTLVLHRATGHLSCHHCGHGEPVPQQCGECGSLSVARYGAGTERIEEELTSTLGVPVFRLDADTTTTKNSVPELLASFREAPEGVLLGTQMVAKGHDFPDVTLAVVLSAEATLRFPDFRAEERTFALIAQLAGRAGRGPQGGKVLVQTISPDAPAILAAAQHDTEGFLAEELARRAALSYPPYSDLMRVTCSAPQPHLARAAARAIAASLKAELGEGGTASILGPAELFRLRDRFRFQLVIKAHDRSRTLAALRRAVSEAARAKDHRMVAFSVDVDPC